MKITKSYIKFILVPWKIAAFVAATIGLVVGSEYAGDPTWDYGISIIMATLTFLSAPWAVGTVYKFIKKEVHFRQFYIAVFVWLISVSISYDLYVRIKFGVKPESSKANLLISGVWYIAAGLFWNLCSNNNKLDFAFRSPNWYSLKKKPTQKSFYLVGGLIAFFYGFILWSLINA